MKKLALSAVALLLALFAIVLVNFAATPLVETLLPGSLAEGLPTTDGARALMLAIVFAAGAAGAFVAVVMAPDRPVGHALVYFCVILLIDLLAAISLRATQPAWFVLGVVAIVPPQAWLGAMLGLKVRRRWAPLARGAGSRHAADAALAPESAGPLPIGGKES